MEYVFFILIALGTFFPLVGMGITFVVAEEVSGRAKFYVMLLGPALTFVITILIGRNVEEMGNMLFVLIYMLFVIFLMIYYPVLLINATLKAIKQKKENNGSTQ